MSQAHLKSLYGVKKCSALGHIYTLTKTLRDTPWDPQTYPLLEKCFHHALNPVRKTWLLSSPLRLHSLPGDGLPDVKHSETQGR